MRRIHRRIWQAGTAGLAMGLLTMSAAAQLDQEAGIPQREGEVELPDPQEEQRDAATERDGLTIGTVDLLAVSRAYEQGELQVPTDPDDPSAQATGQAREFRTQPPRQEREFPEEDAEAPGPVQDPVTGEELQDPQQQQPEEPLFDDPADEARLDRAFIEEVSQLAQQVAGDQGVDLVVLEVIHQETADFNTVDLTNDLIERLREQQDQRGPEGAAEPQAQEAEPESPPADGADAPVDDEADDAAR